MKEDDRELAKNRREEDDYDGNLERGRDQLSRRPGKNIGLNCLGKEAVR